MHIVPSALLVLPLLAALVAPVRADELHLTSGKVLHGRLEEQTRGGYKFLEVGARRAKTIKTKTVEKLVLTYKLPDFVYEDPQWSQQMIDDRLASDFNPEWGEMEILRNQSEPWRVTLIDTGQETMTGGRIGRVLPLLQDEEAFHLTYGDGVGNVDIAALAAFHKSHGKLATVTAVPPPRRFGQLQIEGDAVTDFLEKPIGDGGVINGGFFVLSPKVGKYLLGDETIWERAPLQGLANDGELHAFEHRGFWQPMDTLRERQELEEHWASGKAPWKVWE